MNRWIVYALLGLVALAGFAAAAAPARLIYELAVRPSGIEAGLVHGTVWDAEARRVRAAGLRLAEAEARLHAAPLLTGRAVMDVALIDPALRGAGRVTMSPGRTVIENATGVLGLDAVPALAAADLPPGQSARIEIDRLELGPQGRCLSAAGRVTSAALVAAGEQYGAALPALTADLACAGDAVALDFEGRGETLDLSGRVRLMADGPQWRIVGRTRDRDIIAALSLMGFSQSGPDEFIAESTP
ncbi:MAG: type II secretion system protein N [Oceanicaulis sp.]